MKKNIIALTLVISATASVNSFAKNHFLDGAKFTGNNRESLFYKECQLAINKHRYSFNDYDSLLFEMTYDDRKTQFSTKLSQVIQVPPKKSSILSVKGGCSEGDLFGIGKDTCTSLEVSVNNEGKITGFKKIIYSGEYDKVDIDCERK